MHYANSSCWNNPIYYYLAAPANFYSKFFHDISLGKLAYGFCYDGVNDQSTFVYTPAIRGVVVKIYW